MMLFASLLFTALVFNVFMNSVYIKIKMVKQFTLPNLSMIVLNDEVFPCSE